MKKKIVFAVISICIIILIILAMINNSSKALAELETIDGITMTIKENSLTNTSTTIVITNNTEVDYSTGQKYRIDKNVNESWYKLSMKEDMVTTMESLAIFSGDSLEMNLNWEKYYGKLEPGKYRIVKDVTAEDNPKKYNVAVEFIIE